MLQGGDTGALVSTKYVPYGLALVYCSRRMRASSAEALSSPAIRFLHNTQPFFFPGEVREEECRNQSKHFAFFVLCSQRKLQEVYRNILSLLDYLGQRHDLDCTKQEIKISAFVSGEDASSLYLSDRGEVFKCWRN